MCGLNAYAIDMLGIRLNVAVYSSKKTVASELFVF